MECKPDWTTSVACRCVYRSAKCAGQAKQILACSTARRPVLCCRKVRTMQQQLREFRLRYLCGAAGLDSIAHAALHSSQPSSGHRCALCLRIRTRLSLVQQATLARRLADRTALDSYRRNRIGRTCWPMDDVLACGVAQTEANWKCGPLSWNWRIMFGFEPTDPFERLPALNLPALSEPDQIQGLCWAGLAWLSARFFLIRQTALATRNSILVPSCCGQVLYAGSSGSMALHGYDPPERCGGLGTISVTNVTYDPCRQSIGSLPDMAVIAAEFPAQMPARFGPACMAPCDGSDYLMVFASPPPHPQAHLGLRASKRAGVAKGIAGAPAYLR